MFDVGAASTTPDPAATSARPRPGLPIEPRRVLHAIGRSKRVLASFAVAGALGGVVAAKLLVSRTYESAAVLGWEGAAFAGETASGDRELKSIADGVKTPQTLSDIRARIGEPTTLESLGRRIEVRTKRDSDLLILAATGDAASSTTALAQATMEVFLEQRLEIERARLEEEAKRKESNLVSAEEGLATARDHFDVFRSDNGLMDMPIERQAALDHLARLRSEADLASASADGSRAQVGIFEEAARSEPAVAVLSEKELRPGKKRLAEARSELAGLSGSLDAQHPRFLALEAEIDALAAAADRPDHASTAERTIGRNPHWEALEESLATARAAEKEASTRKAAYEELAKTAESQIAALTTVEGEAARLLGDIKVGEQRVAELQTLHAGLRDRVRTPRSGFRVLAAPQEPDRPIKSARKLVALVGGPLGLILALFFVVARELRGLRLKAPREVAFWAERPVVASSPWPARDTLDDLVLDVREHAPPGERLLLVPVDVASLAGAETLAAALAAERPEVENVPMRNNGNRTGSCRCLLPDAGAATARRSAGQADRILLVATAGSTSVLQLRAANARLGRPSGVGVVLLGVGCEFAMLPDRVGDLASLLPSQSRDSTGGSAPGEIHGPHQSSGDDDARLALAASSPAGG